MPYNKAQVQQRLDTLKVNRQATEQDVTNANANPAGLNIFDKQFGGQQSSIPTNTTTKPQTSNQAGAAALKSVQPDTSLAEASLDVFKDQTPEETVDQISEQGFAVQELIQQGLNAKMQAKPYDRKIARVNRKIGKLSINDYKDMPIEQALGFLRKDFADLNAQKGYFQTKLEESQKSASELVDSVANMLNSQLAAAGLQVQRNDAEAQRAIDIAFSAQGLLSGVMPPGVPENLRKVWEAQSLKAKEQEAYSRRPKGGSGSGKGKDPDAAFRSAVGDAIMALDTNKLEWGTAWDLLHTQFPEKSNAEIDAALGGSFETQVPYKDAQPTGRAASTYGTGESEATTYTKEQVWDQLDRLSDEERADSDYVIEQILRAGHKPSDFGY